MHVSAHNEKVQREESALVFIAAHGMNVSVDNQPSECVGGWLPPLIGNKANPWNIR